VFYRDRSDAYLTVQQGLTKGIDSTIDFIGKQRADGGGDYPEALEAGLAAAIETFRWSRSARARIIFLILDAPPHEEARDNIVSLTAKAAALGIRIVPIACSGTDKTTEFLMRSMALATNGTYIFLTDDSGIGESHIKPTTDEFKVELLNDVLKRIIRQMCFASDCNPLHEVAIPAEQPSNGGKIVLYPNPARDVVTIQTNQRISEVFLTDFTGKILSRKVFSPKSSSYSLSVAAYPAGTYFIKYSTYDKTYGSEKLVLIR